MGEIKRIVGLNFQPGEGKLVGLLATHNFFLGAASVFTESLAFAAFLQTFGPGGLPYMYMAMPVGASLVALIYMRLAGRISLPKLLVGNLLFMAVVNILLRLGLLLPGPKGLIFLLPIWFQVLANLSLLALWGLAGRLLDLRQGKRLFGFIGSGNWAAVAAGGFLVTPVVNILGAPNLLILASISIFVSIIFQVVLIRTYSTRLKPSQPAQATSKTTSKPQTNPLKSRYAQLIMLLVVLFWVGFYFIDNIFNTGAAAQFRDANQLTNALGNVYALSGVLGLIVTTFLTGPLISRFGMRTTLFILPVLLVASFGGFALAGVFNAAVISLFWIAAIGKIISIAFGFSLDLTSRNILYQPMPAAQRTSVQTMAEAVVQPVAIGLAGVLLLAFGTLLKFNAVQLSLVFVSIGLIWVGVVFALRKEYPRMLVQALAKRRLTGLTLSVDDSTTLEVIRKGLSSSNPNAVIYSLDLISQADSEGYLAILVQLLHNPAPEVRRVALERLEKDGGAKDLPAIHRLLRQEGNSAVRAAAIRALASLGGSEVQPEIQAYYDDPARSYRQAALTGSIRGGSLEGLSAASLKLQKMSKSSMTADRSLAAVVLGEAGLTQYTQPLLALLMDAEYNVRRQALNSAAQLKHRDVWPLVVANLSLPRSRRAALCALGRGGETALAEIRKEFVRQDTSPAVLILLAKACGRIGGSEAICILEERLDDPMLEVRTQVLFALKRLGYQAGRDQKSRIKQYIQEEASYAAWLSSLLEIMEKDSRAEVLCEALEYQFSLCRERIFCLLSFVYPRQSIINAQEALRRMEMEHTSNAIEALDVALPQKLKVMLFPIIENLTLAERNAHLRTQFSQPQRTLDRCLDAIMNREHQVDQWTRLCAEYVARNLEGTVDGGKNMLSAVEKVIILKSVSIFREIPGEILAEVAQVCGEIEAEAGTSIFTQGDLGDSLYVVVDGCVRVHDGQNTLNTLGASEVFGEMALLDPAPRLASVTAAEDTRLLRIDQEAFLELLEDQPQVAQGIIRVLTRRLRDRVKDLDELRTRVAPAEA